MGWSKEYIVTYKWQQLLFKINVENRQGENGSLLNWEIREDQMEEATSDWA